MKKILLALLTGIILTLSWPVYGFPLLLFFSFVPLLFLEYQIRHSSQKRKGAKVFGLAYLSFFIWNLLTTFWIYYSTAVGMVFAILVNSLLMTLVFYIFHRIARKVDFLVSSVFLITLWISFEYMHLHWQFSWPWLNLGNGFSEYPQWIQWYEYTGTFGGTLWVWIGNILIFKALLSYKEHKEKKTLTSVAIRLLLWIGLPLTFSYYLWFSYPNEKQNPSVDVLILQPNIDPYVEKYNTDDLKVGQLLEEMTKENIKENTRLIIAPETVFADGTELDDFNISAARFYSGKIVDQYPDASLLSGISFYKLIRDEDSVETQTNFLRPGLWFNDYNSAFMVANNQKDQLYHKSKLVVGVENFPYQNLLKPILGDIMIDLGGTVAKKTTQEDRGVFNFDEGIKTGPIICYESVYGEFVNGYVTNGAQFLSIITNDAWWDNTQGHKQHLSYARLRAIENRRDVARSANTGISAVINQRGEILKQTKYEERAAINASIHLNDKLTFYSKHGDYLARVSGFVALLFFLLAVSKRRSDLEL